MVGWVFSVEGLVDKLTRKRRHLVVNKAVIYMRVGGAFRDQDFVFLKRNLIKPCRDEAIRDSFNVPPVK